MESTLDPESLFLIVDFLKRKEALAPVAEQLETLINEHQMLGCGQRWDGTSYTRSYDDLIRKFPLASTVFSNRLLQHDDAEEPRPNWIGLAAQRLFTKDTIIRRIQNRSIYGRLRSCPPSLYGRYRHIKTTWGHHGPVFCVAFDRTGKRVITGSDDHRVKIWRTCDGALEFSLLGHTAPISDIAVSVCNVFVGSASADFTVRLWYLRDGTLVRVLQLNAEVTRLVFHSDYVICTTMDGSAHALLLSDAASHGVLTAPRPVAHPVTCEALSVSISPCQHLFAVGYSHGHVGFFSVDLLGEGFMNPFSDIDISSSGEIVTVAFSTVYSEDSPLRLAVGSHTGKFHILSRNNNGLFDIQHALVHNEIRQPEPTNLVVILAWASGDSRLVTTYHNSIHVWSAISGDLLFHRAIRGHGSDILSMSVHPVFTEALFTVSVDGSAIVTSLLDGMEIVKFPATDLYQLIDCSFSPNGDFICATSDLGRLVFFGTGSRRRYAKVPDSQFFTFENPTVNSSPQDLQPRVLCDAEFEVYRLQPRHLVQSHVAHDLSEADSAVDSDASEDLRPPPPPPINPYVDFDDVSFDPHVVVAASQPPEPPERHMSEEEESFSMSSETENEEEDDLDEVLSDEDLDSFQIPVNVEIDPDRRGPNTRRTRRHDSGSDSDQPIRRRHRHRQVEEAGNAPDSEAIPRRRRSRRRPRRERTLPDPTQISQTTNAIRDARPARQRRVERTASQQSALSNRSSNLASRELLQASVSEDIVSRLRARNRTSVIPQQPSTAPAAVAVPRRIMPRRQNVLNNQQSNPVSTSPSRIRTRSSLSSAAALPSLTASARVTRQRTAIAGVSTPGTPPRRSSREVVSVPQSDQPLRARRQRVESHSVTLQPARSGYHTRSHSIVAAGGSVNSSGAHISNSTVNSADNIRSQASHGIAATGRTTRTSQRAVENAIVSSLSPQRRRSMPSLNPPPSMARSFSPIRTRNRFRSPNPRIRDLSESSDGDDVPVRLLQRRRFNEDR